MKPLVNRLALTAYALAAVVIGLDQWLKYWVVEVYRLADRGTAPVFGPLHFTMVWNRGFSFGILNGDAQWSRWALTVFSIAVATGVGVWVRRADRALLGLAAGFVMGGALGNVVDRVRFGAVVDFIDVSQLHFPWVFNLADASINVGVALVLCDTLLAPRKAPPV